MKAIVFFRYILVPAALFIFALVDVIRKRYEITKINNDHIFISRMFMTEKVIYSKDIKSITLKKLEKNKAKIIIQSDQNQLKYFSLGIIDYQNLVRFSKSNKIDLIIERSKGDREKMNNK